MLPKLSPLLAANAAPNHGESRFPPSDHLRSGLRAPKGSQGTGATPLGGLGPAAELFKIRLFLCPYVAARTFQYIRHCLAVILRCKWSKVEKGLAACDTPVTPETVASSRCCLLSFYF